MQSNYAVEETSMVIFLRNHLLHSLFTILRWRDDFLSFANRLESCILFYSSVHLSTYSVFPKVISSDMIGKKKERI